MSNNLIFGYYVNYLMHLPSCKSAVILPVHCT